jgi:hypothetical protein
MHWRRLNCCVFRTLQNLYSDPGSIHQPQLGVCGQILQLASDAFSDLGRVVGSLIIEEVST